MTKLSVCKVLAAAIAVLGLLQCYIVIALAV